MVINVIGLMGHVSLRDKDKLGTTHEWNSLQGQYMVLHKATRFRAATTSMSIHPDNLVAIYSDVLAPARINNDIIWAFIVGRGTWLVEWVSDYVVDDLKDILSADSLLLIQSIRYAPAEVAHAFVFLAANEFPVVKQMLIDHRPNAQEQTAFFLHMRLPGIVENYFRGQSIDTFAANARVGYIATVGF